MNLAPLPVEKFFDNNGNPMNGGLLFTYVAGTTTKIATYTDSSGGTPNTNPVVLDYRGEARVWLDPTLVYKFTLAPPGDTDPPTKPIWTVDNITSAISFADLTQQIIGRILYPRTAAEIAAGVTPTYYYYEPGNVLRYGAAGNNVTNDSPAFQAAFDQAAKAGGASVWIPQPAIAYLLNAQINAATNRPITIKGSGWGWTPGGVPGGGCIVRLGSLAGANAAAFDWADFVQGVEISGISFLLSSTGNTHKGIRFQEVLQCDIHDCRFEGASSAADDQTGIELVNPVTGGGTYTGEVRINKNYFTNLRFGTVIRANCTTVNVIDNTYYGNDPAAASQTGVFVETNSVGPVILGNTFQGWVRGIDNDGTSVTIAHNYFETCTTSSYDCGGASLPQCFGNKIISGANPIFPATSQAMIDFRSRNCRVDDAYLEMGLGYKERYRTLLLGDWTTYAPAYTGSGTLTFTAVTSTTIRYRLVGNTIQVQWFLDGTVGGAGDQIRIALPTGATAVGRARNVVHNFEAAAFKAGVAEVQNGEAFVRVYANVNVSGNWTAGAGGTYGDIEFLVSGV